jgi:CheY-like chemotaxis protein
LISVLVVEDEVALAANIATYLESFGGEFETVTATSGEAALSVMGERKLDVVLTDLRLPGIDGIEVVRRALAAQPHTRILVMTAYGSEEARRQALREGAVRFVEKPVDLGHLRRLLMEIGTGTTGWSGSFRGLDIFDFTQLFTLSRKSRAVWVRLGSRSGQLVFRGGEVVHASTDTLSGAEAFYDMVEWEGGELEEVALPDEGTVALNVALPTTHLLMEAARLRDERIAGASPGRDGGRSGSASRAPDPALARELEGMLEGYGRACYAAVLGDGGRPLAEAGALEGVCSGELWEAVQPLLESYPRPGLRRLLVEDGSGTVVVAALSGARRLLVVGDGGERIGAVLVRVERLVQSLQGQE